MGYTEAQKEATARYNKKAYDRIDIIVPKGKRAQRVRGLLPRHDAAGQAGQAGLREQEDA